VIALGAAAGQLVAMLASGDVGSLFPLGVGVLLVLGIPNYVAARFGGWLRERWRPRA
jgi:hypothetical protein